MLRYALTNDSGMPARSELPMRPAPSVRPFVRPVFLSPMRLLRAGVGAIRRWSSVVVYWLRSRSPEQYFWAFMAAILVVYALVLVLGSTAVGRGGR